MKLRKFFLYYIVWPVGVFFTFVLASYAVPAILNGIHAVVHKELSYEMAMRIYILFVYTFIVGLCAWWTLRKGAAAHTSVLVFFAITLFSVLVVLVGDRKHIVMEEWHWIRYPSAAMLYLAGLFAFMLARRAAQTSGSKVALLFLIPSGIALWFAGTDELAQIHEYLGRFIHGSSGLIQGSGGNDFITLGYAAGIALTLVFVGRWSMRDLASRSYLFWPVFILGTVAYAVSVGFDTFDIVLKNNIHKIVVLLSRDSSSVFSDPWYLVYHPRVFFNSVEEVLELTAAAAFAAGFFLLLRTFHREDTILPQSDKNRVLSHGIAGVLLATTLILLIASYPSTRGVSIFAKAPSGAHATMIGGEPDGLLHADDLIYTPHWGVLLANEGGQNVYQYKDSILKRMPDVGHRLHDTDSITATDTDIYVSDGGAGTIFRFDGNDQWEALWTKKDGIMHPEALVEHDGALYVLDTIQKQEVIVRLKKGEEPVIWHPQHPNWRAPEAIEYDPAREKFVVTDDETGSVFELEFNKSIHEIARLQNAEELILSKDGSILVTDNGNATVWRIANDNTVTSLFTFKRPYRDLQGIAVDRDDNVFVVTADDVAGVSYMPSFLFRITGIHL